MSKLKIAYFGTPYFSARLLEKILTDTLINQSIEVKFVVTASDKPVGRKMILTSTPVKQVANKYKIPVVENLKKLQVTGYKLQDLDLALLYAYGAILPNNLLNLPRLGFLNTHPSLLPKYRGTGPISYPLMLGDTKTGVTLIKLDEKIDHGPIIAQEELEILQVDKRPDLEIKLTDLAFKMFKQLISTNFNQFQLIQQNHNLATFTRKLTKQDGFVRLDVLKKVLESKKIEMDDLPELLQKYISKNNLIENWKLKIGNSPKIIFDYFRGLFPWPGIWTLTQPLRLGSGLSKRLKITEMLIEKDKLIITRVQLEGKNEVNFETFNKAYKVF